MVLVVFVPSVARAPLSLDVSEYHRHARAFLARPGMSWPLEYPPTAILPMLPAAVLLAFGLEMASVGAVLYGVLRQREPVAVRTWLLRCALGGIFIICTRFDMVPSLFVVLALLAAERGRWRRAWAWTGAAAALEWFGAVLGPLGLLVEWRAAGRWRWDRAVAAGGAAQVSCGLAALAQARTPSAASWGKCIARWRSSRWPQPWARSRVLCTFRTLLVPGTFSGPKCRPFAWFWSWRRLEDRVRCGSAIARGAAHCERPPPSA